MTDVLPPVNARAEISMFGGGTYGCRVDAVDDDHITLAAPLNLLVGDLPETGAPVTVRWSAGPRGRYALPAAVVEVVRQGVLVWLVRADGEAQIEQNRRYVRGGGGEAVQIRIGEASDPEVVGKVIDLSECGLRARFTGVRPEPGTPAWLRVRLDDEEVTVAGEVLKTLPHLDGKDVEVVTVYESDESQAQTIRRYVMRQQMLARRAAED